MKRFTFFLLAATVIFLTSCETNKEITLNEDGSGKIVTTNDMSALLGLAKMQGGGGEEMKKLEDMALDTTIGLASIADSIETLTAEEKKLASTGKLNVVMKMADDKGLTKVELPFSDLSQISKMEKLSGKMLQEGMKKVMEGAAGQGGGMPPMGEEMPSGSMEDYFVTTYTKTSISRKLDTEKYAKIGEDEGMQAMKGMIQMGVGNSTLIINLPRPAKKAEGAGVTLSADKKKVTIADSAEEFFDNGKKLEFLIEY